MKRISQWSLHLQLGCWAQLVFDGVHLSAFWLAPGQVPQMYSRRRNLLCPIIPSPPFPLDAKLGVTNVFCFCAARRVHPNIA